MLGLVGRSDHSLGQRGRSCPEGTVRACTQRLLFRELILGAHQAHVQALAKQSNIHRRGVDGINQVYPVPWNSVWLLKTKPVCRFTGKIHTMCLN